MIFVAKHVSVTKCYPSTLWIQIKDFLLRYGFYVGQIYIPNFSLVFVSQNVFIVFFFLLQFVCVLESCYFDKPNHLEVQTFQIFYFSLVAILVVMIIVFLCIFFL